MIPLIKNKQTNKQQQKEQISQNAGAARKYDQWIGPWSNYRVQRKKEIVVMETAVLPEVMKYLRHSICNMSIIFKIRTLKRGKLIILAVV